MNNEPTWRATVAAINALPHPVRRYLQLLEDRVDSTGTLREAMILQQQVTDLTHEVATLRARIAELEGPANDS